MAATPKRTITFAGITMTCPEAGTAPGDVTITATKLRRILLTGLAEARCLGTISLEGVFRESTITDWGEIDLELLRSGERDIRQPGKGLERTLNTWKRLQAPAVYQAARGIIYLPQQVVVGPGWEIRERPQPA